MKMLPVDVGDEGLLRPVGEWVDLLAEERYQDAYDFLYHPWMPVLEHNELSADDIRDILADYIRDSAANSGWGEPHLIKVTPVELMPPGEVSSHQEITRYEVPQERAWDAALVRFGGVPSGASNVGDIHYSIPLGSTWSDLTAIFNIVLYEWATVLALESMHVL